MKQFDNGTKILLGFSLSCAMAACATQTETAAVTAPAPETAAVTPAPAAPSTAQASPAVESTAASEKSAPVAAMAAPAPEPAKVSAEVAREPTAAPESHSTRTVAELAAQIRKDRRALYVSHDGSYQFYVGGVLKAKYFPEEQKLVVLDMSSDQAQPCNYNIDGKLQTKAKSADNAKSCTDLVGKLDAYLTHP